MEIIAIDALQVLDSRGNPTVKVDIVLDDGSKGSFMVPSGASTGIHEAHELRDHDETKFLGQGVEKAVSNVLGLQEKLFRREFTQQSFDRELIDLDGTENKELFGANAILGLSCAFARASAKYYNLSLHEYLYRLKYSIKFTNKTTQEIPTVTPFSNVINGGLHAGNDLQVQEFMIIPLQGDFFHKTRVVSEIYHTLKSLIQEKYGKESTAVGDEGGFAPALSKSKEALDLLVEATQKCGYTNEIAFALDAAASDFYDIKTKRYEIEKGLHLDYKELTEYYNDLLKGYPLISIEDPMAEDDFEGFMYFMENAQKPEDKNPFSKKKELLIVGDDLLVTNPKRILEAQKEKLCNSLLLKINQIGSLTEAIEAHKLAESSGWHTIVSHRSGETSDDFIADLAYALSSSIKLGAPARGERVAKYNRLLEIYSKVK
jgi:enolase